MSSKYIPNKSKQNTNSYVWSNYPTPAEKPNKEELEERKRHDEKKQQLNNKTVEEITFRDIYSFPFKGSRHSWVYDSESNFIFQFQFDNDDTENKILKILNGEITEYKRQFLKHEQGMIYVLDEGQWKELILIRGWGNLTGVGGYNLPPEKAVKIQDTLAEFIIEKLGK